MPAYREIDHGASSAGPTRIAVCVSVSRHEADTVRTVPYEKGAGGGNVGERWCADRFRRVRGVSGGTKVPACQAASPQVGFSSAIWTRYLTFWLLGF